MAQPTEKVTWGFEPMAWWFQGSPTPTPIISDGVLGRPGTQVLLGGGDVNTNPNAGFRVTLFYTPKLTYGVEVNYLWIGERSQTDGVSTTGLPGSANLFVPYYNVVRNAEDISEVSSTGSYSGSASTELTNSMQGAEINVTWPVAAKAPWDFTVFGGFRWLRLKEKYQITTNSPYLPPTPAGVWTTADIFDASNKFYGGQIGARGNWRQGNWMMNGAVQVALGGMVQDMSVQGSLVTDDFQSVGVTQTFPGGYFALPTNIGSRSRTVFAAVPELRLNVGYFFTPKISLSVGYDVLYASNVARPGNQIDRNINPSQAVSYTGDPPAILLGPAQPTFNWNSSSFWAQAVSATLHIRY
ncbi:MAG: BBP7 family outer membrane beta-barrel protein [Burkholderiales bacterium]|nr:BBP7 family outer membrane beta-barrel protein [Burkholderiales bacterium]